MFLSNRNGNSIMALFHQSLGALILAVLSLPAHAVYVAVHNQGHYSVRFEVNGRDSGFFEVGQSRIVENASGTIRLVWRPSRVLEITGCPATTVTVHGIEIGQGLFTSKKFELRVGNNNVDIVFHGDTFNPVLRLNGFDPVDVLGFDLVNDIPVAYSVNFNGEYKDYPILNASDLPSHPSCEWVKK